LTCRALRFICQSTQVLAVSLDNVLQRVYPFLFFIHFPVKI